MKYFIPLLLFFLCCSSLTVTALEIKIVDEATSSKIIAPSVSEKGIGSFYLELAFNLPCNITNVDSDKFLVAYNIMNSTLLIAGAQGEVPGPSGDVILCIVNYEGEPQFKILKAIVSDVDGNTILSNITPSQYQTSNSQSAGEAYTMSSPSPTPASPLSPSPTPSPSIVTPLSNPTPPSITPPPTQPVSSPLPTPSQRMIPGFDSAFTIAGLLAVAYLAVRKKKQI
jgi:hypothetical protein